MACTSLSTLAFFCFFTIMLHEGINEVWKPRLRCFSFMAYEYPWAMMGIERFQQQIRSRCAAFLVKRYCKFAG